MDLGFATPALRDTSFGREVEKAEDVEERILAWLEQRGVRPESPSSKKREYFEQKKALCMFLRSSRYPRLTQRRYSAHHKLRNPDLRARRSSRSSQAGLCSSGLPLPSTFVGPAVLRQKTERRNPKSIPLPPRDSAGRRAAGARVRLAVQEHLARPQELRVLRTGRPCGPGEQGPAPADRHLRLYRFRAGARPGLPVPKRAGRAAPRRRRAR